MLHNLRKVQTPYGTQNYSATETRFTPISNQKYRTTNYTNSTTHKMERELLGTNLK